MNDAFVSAAARPFAICMRSRWPCVAAMACPPFDHAVSGLRVARRQCKARLHVMDDKDVRMIQSADCPRFLFEAIKPIGILRKGGRQNFDRHVPATLDIACTAAFLSEAEDALPLPAKSNPKTPSVMSFKNKSRTRNSPVRVE